MKNADSISIETRAIGVARVANLTRQRSQKLRSDSRGLRRQSRELLVVFNERFRIFSTKRELGMKLGDPACPASAALEKQPVEMSSA